MYRCLTGGQRVRNNDDLQLIVCLSLTPSTGPLCMATSLSSLLFESMMNGPELQTQLSLRRGSALSGGFEEINLCLIHKYQRESFSSLPF